MASFDAGGASGRGRGVSSSWRKLRPGASGFSRSDAVGYSVGSTQRRDAWWLGPLLTVLGLSAFLIYGLWAAWQDAYFEIRRSIVCGVAAQHNQGIHRTAIEGGGKIRNGAFVSFRNRQESHDRADAPPLEVWATVENDRKSDACP